MTPAEYECLETDAHKEFQRFEKGASQLLLRIWVVQPSSEMTCLSQHSEASSWKRFGRACAVTNMSCCQNSLHAAGCPFKRIAYKESWTLAQIKQSRRILDTRPLSAPWLLER